MKWYFAFFFLILLNNKAFGKSKRDSLLSELDKVIENTHLYDADKLQTIRNIKKSLVSAKNLTDQYNIYLKLYEEYKIFNFDSAFVYARKLEKIASRLNDPVKLVAAKNNIAFVLLSAGMFKETAVHLNTIAISNYPDSLKADYYALMARYYYDLADYVNDEFHSPTYIEKGNKYLDSALLLYPANFFKSVYYRGLHHLKKGSIDNAYTDFHILLNRPGLTHHQLALITSTLSNIYLLRKDVSNAIDYLVLAAIADIQSSTKETFAIFYLAQLLFEKGDFNRASTYIEKAIADASFYGARQRKVQVSTILPIIQSTKINNIEQQRKLWIIYGVVVTLFLVILIYLIVVIYRQYNKLKKAERIISAAHASLREANTKLQEVNADLQKLNLELHQVNSKLLEANKIKEEYIGYFFNINSGFFLKIERFKRLVEQKIADRKVEEIKTLVNGINVKNEKEELLKSFDKVFLKLFPNFVEEFNALFDEKDQLQLKDDEHMNTELRIYALMRMGITENENIAQILEYSIKTIYAYKTKIRNRTKVPKEEFDKRVMRINFV